MPVPLNGKRMNIDKCLLDLVDALCAGEFIEARMMIGAMEDHRMCGGELPVKPLIHYGRV
jgi:hypothetical protein